MDDLVKAAGILSTAEKLATAELAKWVEESGNSPIPRTLIDESCRKHSCDSRMLIGRLTLWEIIREVPRKALRFGKKGTLATFHVPELPDTPKNNQIARECWELYQPTARLVELRGLCAGEMPTDPNVDALKAKAKQLAVQNLKGARRRIVEIVCDAVDPPELSSLAVDQRINWQAPYHQSWSSAQRGINKEMKKIHAYFGLHDGCVTITSLHAKKSRRSAAALDPKKRTAKKKQTGRGKAASTSG